jgi:SAM-dependent methyltransferase
MTDALEDWFADESFWVRTYPFMFPPSRMSAADGEIQEILTLVGHSDGGAVLDLACGPGRHSIALARRGFTVTGVDRSAFLLGQARSRAAAEQAHVEWVESDMREFVRQRVFDIALSLFTSFGFFRDDSDNQKVLDNVAVSLRAGGVFVLDVAGKEVLARIFNPTASREVPGGLVIHRREVVDDWNQLRNEWILLEDGTMHRFMFRHWIYSGREIRWMFQRAGFGDVALYGNFAGSSYGAGAERLVVVGRMPTT